MRGQSYSSSFIVFSNLAEGKRREEEAITSDTCTFSQIIFRFFYFNDNPNMNKSIPWIIWVTTTITKQNFQDLEAFAFTQIIRSIVI